MDRAEDWKKMDERMNYKLDFMYDAMDFDHDRARVRRQFLKNVNQRTTLEDIGEELDKLVIDSKASNYKHYDLIEHHNTQPDSVNKEFGSDDFQWSKRLLKQHDPKTPNWYEDDRVV